MGDSYWRYAAAGPRHAAGGIAPPPAAPLKRPRSDYPDMPGGPEMLNYYPREEERAPHRPLRDTESINASYDRYLREGASSFGSAADPARHVSGGMNGRSVDDPRMMRVGGMDGRAAAAGYGGDGRPEQPLPPDASKTLFVEGLPADCTRREVSHIFRPFVGFREVRLVNKESRHPGGEPLVLCFVDFTSPNQAAIALEALEGYKIDEHDRESATLRLQFARFPGPRSNNGPPRGRR